MVGNDIGKGEMFGVKSEETPLKERGHSSYMETEPSIFARIESGEIPAAMVDQGKRWFALLDIQPRLIGHTLVVPRKQVQHLRELEADDLAALMKGVVRVQKLLASHFGSEDFNVMVNDGVAAGQEVPHVHIHVIPRLMGDAGGQMNGMFPSSPLPGEVDPDFDALNELALELRRGRRSDVED